MTELDHNSESYGQAQACHADGASRHRGAVRGALSAVLILLVGLCAAAPALASAPSIEQARVKLAAASSDLAFEPNRGQFGEGVRWLARGTGYMVQLTDEGAVFVLSDGREYRAAMLRPGARARAISPEAPLAGRSHYVDLDTQVPPIADVPRYARVRYAEVWPGIDLVFYGRDGRLEYDFEVAADADASQIHLTLDGARLQDDGSLAFGAKSSELARFEPPVSFEIDARGERVPIRSAYRMLADGRIGFEHGLRTAGRRLVIDPVLVYSTFLGGGGTITQDIKGVAVGGDGSIYLTGTTGSTSFPIFGAGNCDNELNDQAATNSCSGSPNTIATDAFLTKLNADGELVFSTYMGGANYEQATALAVNAAGEAHVAGWTWNGLDMTTSQAFLLRMRADGAGAVFATVFGQAPPGGYVGYDYVDQAETITLDAAGNVYIGGFTSSPSFHPGGIPGLDQSYGGDGDGFVQRYAVLGSAPWNQLTHSTYIGAGFAQYVEGLAMGTDGTVVVAGRTLAIDQIFGDIYALRLNATLSGVAVGAAIIQGTAGDDRMKAIKVDPQNRSWIVGETTSNNFCTGVGAGLDPNYNGPSDGYAFRLAADHASVDYCTYAGGNGCDRVTDVSINGSSLTLVGGTQPGASAGTPCGGQQSLNNAFALRIDVGANLLNWTYSFSHAGSYDQSEGVAIDPWGRVIVAGTAGGQSFPVTPDAIQTVFPASVSAGFAMIIDPVTRVHLADAQITEGNSGTANLNFEVSLNGWPLDNVSFNYATANGSAAAPGDFTAVSNSCTNCFQPLSAPVINLSVPVVGDTSVEPNETFTLNLSGLSANAVFDRASATGTIVNDDNAGSVRLSSSTYAVGEAGVNAVLTLQRTGGSSGAVSVRCQTAAGGTATAGSDFTATDAVVSWANADAADKTCSIPIANDGTDETNETVNIALASPTGDVAIGSPSTAVLTINDDDPAPAITITDTSVTEGDSGTVSAGVTVNLDRPSSATVTVDWASADGTATAGSDYVNGAGTLTFSPGETSKPITRAVNGDTLVEANETFSINLSNATNATISDGTGVVTINNDDAGGTLAFSAASSSSAETGTATLTVNRSGGAASGVSVSYSVTGGNATGGGTDYTLAAGTLNFGAGETSKTISVAIAADTIDEADETVVVTLASPAGGATLGSPAAHTLTISDDDSGGVLAFGAATANTSENGTATITVFRSSGVASGVSVNYAISAGTATPGVDFETGSGTLNFAAGESSKTFGVVIHVDAQFEPNETIVITLSAPTGGATLGSPSTQTLTILDDDASDLIFMDSFDGD